MVLEGWVGGGVRGGDRGWDWALEWRVMEKPTADELGWLYRIGVCVCGEAEGARGVVARVVGRVPEPGKASEGRLLGLVVELARGTAESGGRVWWEGGGVAGVGEAGRGVMVALGGLDREDREAWALVEGVGVDAAVAGCAFGGGAGEVRERCERAGLGLGRELGAAGLARGVEEFRVWARGFSLGMDDAGVGAAWAGACRRRRAVLMVGLVFVVVFVGLMGFVVWDLLGWDERQAANEVFSNPMPRELGEESLSPANR